MGFIWEAHYLEWLSNVVLVKKASRKLQMCIDLNRAYTEDNFPLRCIDLIVDWTTGHPLFSFMDT